MSRIVGRKIRWASEATQGSQDKLRHQGTMLANQHSWADNLALLEDWRQAFVWVWASPYFVPTAFKWLVDNNKPLAYPQSPTVNGQLN